MDKPKKPRADSKLKNLPAEDQEAIWTLMHPTDKDTPAMTLEAVAAAVMDSYRISVGLSTLSEWHSWFALERRMLNARNRANQTAVELARNSDMSPADIERVAQTVFTAETLEAGNVKAYVALATLNLERAKLAQADAKIDLSRKALAHDARRLELLEAKAKQADQAKDVLATKLSPEEQNRRLREILK